MATRTEDQVAEIARLAEALAARTEELAETMAALTVMRARYTRLEDEAEVLAAIARAAIPVVTQPPTDDVDRRAVCGSQGVRDLGGDASRAVGRGCDGRSPGDGGAARRWCGR